MNKRACYICREEKLLNEENFYKDKCDSSGFSYKCKDCKKKERNKHYREKMSKEQKEKNRSSMRKYVSSGKGKVLNILRSYKTSDLKKNLEFFIDEEDIEKALGSSCVYCGFPATGLDRVDNNKGHTKENCVPCCKECNITKNNYFSYEEMLVIGSSIKQIKEARLSNI